MKSSSILGPYLGIIWLALPACVTSTVETNEAPKAEILKPQEPMKPAPRGRTSSGERPQKRAVKLLVKQSSDYLDHGYLDKATATLERAYRIDYQDPEVSLMMAFTLFAKGDEEQAEQWALKSLNHWYPSQTQQRRRAWELVSQCRVRRGDYQGANRAIEKARSL